MTAAQDHASSPRIEQPVLGTLAAELADAERLRSFLAAWPARARVSEPLLPLVLAALWLAREPRGPLVCLLPEDADARDVADAVGLVPRQPSR